MNNFIYINNTFIYMQSVIEVFIYFTKIQLIIYIVQSNNIFVM